MFQYKHDRCNISNTLVLKDGMAFIWNLNLSGNSQRIGKLSYLTKFSPVSSHTSGTPRYGVIK